MYDMINMGDVDIRERALSLAVKSRGPTDDADKIIRAATQFEDFLRGPEKSPGDRHTEPMNEKAPVDEDGNRLPPELAHIKKMFEEAFGTEVVFKKYKGDY